MQEKSLFQTIVIVLLLLFCVGIKITHAYMLHKRDHNIIKTAYMNGSVDVLKLDIEKIKQIKSNDEHLKSLVYAAADNYISKVEALSGNKVTIINNRGGIYTEKNAGVKGRVINW